MFFPVVLSFAFGAAVSFGALQYLQAGGAPKEQLVEATAKIDELEQRLSSVNNQLAEADKVNLSLQSLERKISELNDENARVRSALIRITEENTDLKTQLSTGTADSALQKYISDLQGESSDLRNRNEVLEFNKAALGMADKKIAELKAENERLKTDLNSKEVAAADADEYSVQLQKLDLENRKLAADIEAMKKSAAAAAVSSAEEIQGLSSDLSDKLLKIKNLTSQINDLKADSSSRIASLNDQITKMELQLKDSQSALIEANAKLAETQKPAETEPSAPIEQPLTPSKKEREASQVNATVDAATGSVNLTEAQRVNLKSQLIQGECVADSLKTALGRVPVLMLRDLIRDLNSDC